DKGQNRQNKQSQADASKKSFHAAIVMANRKQVLAILSPFFASTPGRRRYQSLPATPALVHLLAITPYASFPHCLSSSVTE
ncbi:MAG: hypothetical protein WA608_08235, partial [Candidatus Acidiferrales bacterium]